MRNAGRVAAAEADSGEVVVHAASEVSRSGSCPSVHVQIAGRRINSVTD